MQIRTKLVLQISITVGLIVLIFSASMYNLASNYRKKEHRSYLKNKANLTFNLLINDKNELDSLMLKKIHKDYYNSKHFEKIIIYKNGETLYHNLSLSSYNYADSLIKKISLKNELFFDNSIFESYGFRINKNNTAFIVIFSAYDAEGLHTLNIYGSIQIIRFVLITLLTLILGLLLARNALSPIVHIIEEIENISDKNLGLRLNEGNKNDELSRLAIEFNKMLDRLEEAFEIQKNFISNASHELRTPLTSITGQIEVALMNKNLDEDTRLLLQSILDDIRNLNKLSNGLLQLMQASSDMSSSRFEEVRIDEIIGQARAEIIKFNPEYTIDVEFSNIPEDEKMLLINGNEQLLKITILNILDNACKYSRDKKAKLKVFFNAKFISITVEDNGMGIPFDDLKQIFNPFYRGANAKQMRGQGIGLALAQRVIKIHKGHIKVSSVINQGTSFNIELPR